MNSRMGREELTKLLLMSFDDFSTRYPEESELESILNFYQAQLARFESNELNASKLVLEGKEKPPADINLNQWASWTAVIRAIMNFDENITKG